MAERLFLIDASSSIYRAFFALPALANAAGLPTNAILGFASMLQKLLREQQPERLAVVWDGARASDRRREMYPGYKAKRDRMPEDLGAQLPGIRSICDAYRLGSVQLDGEEADDVIATLARRAEAAGLEVVIVSTDRDLLQLVSERVCVLDTMRDRRFGPAEVEARFGVQPAQMLDFRALVGDSSDNIPGVAGIGEKGAVGLLSRYGSLDRLLESAGEVPSKRQREALRQGAASARLSRELSRLRDSLALGVDIEDLVVRGPDRPALLELFREFELRRLLDEFEAGSGGGGTEARQAPELRIETESVETPEALAALCARLSVCDRLSLACVLDPGEPMRGELVAIAIGGLSGKAALVPAAVLGPAGLPAPLAALFSDPERVWVGHDLKRDAIALARRGLELRGELRDLAVAAYVIDPSQQVRRPEALTRAFLDASIPAAEDLLGKGARRRGAAAAEPEELSAIWGSEVGTGLELAAQLDQRLARGRELELYEQVEVPLVRVLARMELAGVRIDEVRLRDLAQELGAELARLETRIYALADEEFKIGSTKQLQRVLFEKLALPPGKRTKTGFSTDESVLEELALSHELPAELLGFRRMTKLKNTYVDALPGLVDPETGRIHCTFNQTVAATGRLSASNPNLQNIPIRTPIGQRIREAFIPAEGRLLYSADYSQVELRILAHLSEDERLLRAFASGEDVHAHTAALVFEIPIEAVTPDQRDRMKAVNFGIIYGSSAFGIARTLGIAQAEARGLIKAVFERYPGVRAYLDQAVERARGVGYAETLDGRRRYLPDLSSRNRARRSAAERMAVNSAIQGTAADMIKRAMVRIDAALAGPAGPRAQMILQVHDELVFEVHPEDLRALSELAIGEMRGAAALRVPIEVHAGEGRNWREAH